MKKILVLTAVLLLAASLFATSFSGLGISAIYNEPYNAFELGLYSNYSYTFPVANSPVSLGFGTRLDLSFSLPINTLSLGFITGLSMDVSITDRWDLYLLAGPEAVVSTTFSDDPVLVGFGGGFDIGLTYYFDDQKSSGFSFGSVNYLSATLFNEPGFTFGYYGGIYAGITVRIPSATYTSLPPGFEYIDYIAL